MRETRSNIGMGALALIPIVCCIGIPLIAAAGISVVLAAWVGGIALGGVALVAAVIWFSLRLRRRHGGHAPLLSIMRGRS